MGLHESSTQERSLAGPWGSDLGLCFSDAALQQNRRELVKVPIEGPWFANRALGGSDAALETTPETPVQMFMQHLLSTLCQIFFGEFHSQPASPHLP